jgi:hypothetical protein
LGYDPNAKGLREPSPFEAAVLFALGNRVGVLDMSDTRDSPPVIFLPVEMYGGTVEPERVAARRRKNKAARRARRGLPPRHVSNVLHSRFGYTKHVPGIPAAVK